MAIAIPPIPPTKLDAEVSTPSIKSESANGKRETIPLMTKKVTTMRKCTIPLMARYLSSLPTLSRSIENITRTFVKGVIQ
jgi:hypothetical protein